MVSQSYVKNIKKTRATADLAGLVFLFFISKKYSAFYFVFDDFVVFDVG